VDRQTKLEVRPAPRRVRSCTGRQAAGARADGVRASAPAAAGCA